MVTVDASWAGQAPRTGQYLPPELPGICLKLAAPVRADSKLDLNADAGRPLSLVADARTASFCYGNWSAVGQDQPLDRADGLHSR